MIIIIIIIVIITITTITIPITIIILCHFHYGFCSFRLWSLPMVLPYWPSAGAVQSTSTFLRMAVIGELDATVSVIINYSHQHHRNHKCDQTWQWSSVLTMAIGSQCTRETPSLSGPTTGSLIVIIIMVIFIIIIVIVIVIIINIRSEAMSQHGVSCLEKSQSQPIQSQPLAKTIILISALDSKMSYNLSHGDKIFPISALGNKMSYILSPWQ